MSDRKREHEVESHEVKRYRREEMDKEQNESDDSDYQPYVPLKERRKEKGEQKQVNPQESRWLEIQRCIQSLEHACQCRNDNCSRTSCQKMKRIVLHTKGCTKKGTNTCVICKQLIALNYYHAKTCQDAKCPVPFCVIIKYKFKQIRLNHARVFKRPIATMQNRGMTETVKQATHGSSSLSSQSTPEPKPQASPHLPQPGIGMKLAACPPFAALQAVQQVQAAAPSSTVSHMVRNAGLALPNKVEGSYDYGIANTVLNNLVSNLNLIQNPVLPGVWNCMPNNPITIMDLPRVLANSGSLQSTQATLDDLLATFKASNFSSDHKEHVLAVLKSNSELMAEFIKQRTELLQQQQKQMNEQQNMLEPQTSRVGQPSA